MSVLGMGSVQAQDCEIDGSEFTFEVLKATSPYTRIHWAKIGYVHEFKGLAFYFTDNNSGETYRRLEYAYSDTTDDFFYSELPAGSYTWYVKAFCTYGDTSIAMEQGSIEILDVTPCSVLDESLFTFEVIQANTALTKINWERTDRFWLDYFEGQMAYYFTNDNTGQTYRFDASTDDQMIGGMGTSQLPAGTYTWYARAYCTDGDSSIAMNQGSIEITEGPFNATVYCNQDSNEPTWGEYVDAIYNGSSYEFMVSFNPIINGNDGYTYDSLTRFEVQYKRSDKSEWDSVFQNYGYSDTTLYNGQEAIWIPVNSKGVWQARARVISGNGQAGEWSDTLTNPIYFYIYEDPYFSIGDNTGQDRDILCGYNDWLGVDFDKVHDENEKCSRLFEYFLVNPQGDTIDGPNDGSVSIAWLGNITEPGTYTIAVTIEVEEDAVRLYVPTPYDTTFTIGAVTSCEASLTGSPELNITGFTYYDASIDSLNHFYYTIRVPDISSDDYRSIEAQYYRIGTTDTNSIYIDTTANDTVFNIPINAKGDWVVRLRTRCCGSSFPGALASDWLLSDTIHHYPNFTIENLTNSCNGNGSATVRFNNPFNLGGNMGIRIFDVEDPDYTTYSNPVVSGADIELTNLASGEYQVYVYVSDGTNEACNAYLDTTFTIGSTVKVTIENDSSTICYGDSVLYRAIVTGGTPPYTYLWEALELTYPVDGDSIWITGDMYGDYDPSVTVTDALGCGDYKGLNFTIKPAYTKESEVVIHNLFGDNTYSYEAGTRYVASNQCPFTWGDITYDCTLGDDSVVVSLQTQEGCDSIVHMAIEILSTITALPANSTLDTTISSGESISFLDDGCGDGFYTLNSHSKAIVRAAGGDRDKFTVMIYKGGAVSDEDTLSIYEGLDITEVYNREGTWAWPEGYKAFVISGGVMTVNFNTGSKRGYRMEQVAISVKSPDQLAVTPICGGSGSVQVTNPYAGLYYCLTKPGGSTDTIYCGSEDEDVIFSSLTEAGNYSLRSYAMIIGDNCLALHDTTFTVTESSLEISVTGDNETVCSVNPSVTLTASVSGGEAPYAYSWSNGSTSTSITINEAYASPTVTVTDNSGCTITYATILNWIDYVESEEATEASVCNGAETYTWGSKTITLSDEHLDNGYYVYYDTVESGGTCPTISELHLTVKPNATTEVRVLEWCTSYTWPVNGNSYTTSLGGYSDTVNGCPVTVEYENEAATATHSGVAANGCDSIYSLNLTLIDGIPIPASGTTDTTLATMVEGDTLWVYDNGGMLFNYDIEGDGILILRAPENYAIKVAVNEIALGEGAKVYYTERDEFVGSWYYENNGDNNGHEYASNSGLLKLKYDGGDSPAQGKGFKLAVTVKSLDDTCMSIYNLAKNAEVYGQQTLTWQHTGRISEYRVKVGIQDNTIDEYTPIVDTIVTDTTITLYGDWTPLINGYYPLEIWAICGDNDSSTVYSDWMETQCGFRPGLADGESYHAPAIIKLSSYNEDEIYGQMPPCWSRIGYQIPATDSVFPQLNGVYGGDSDWSGIYFYTNAENDQYAIMPKFDTLYGGMNQWALDFVLELAEYAHQTECDVEPVVLYVGVMDNPSDANSFTVVDSVLVNSNDFRSEYGNEYYVSLANYSGDGLYPAFKMARRSAHNDNPYANPTLMLYEMLVIPDGGLSAPTNLTVTKHPTYDDKAVLSWTEPVWPAYGDDYAVSYVVSTTNSSGNTSSTEVDFGQTSYTFTPTAGDITKITIATKVTSARYNTNWRVESEEVTYEAPFYTHQTVDTIGDLSDERLYSYLMPFEYGNSASSEMLIKADEIDGTTIDAIAFRLAPESCLPPEDFPSFQYVTIYMKDVTLTELDAANMTDDYLFSTDNKVYDGTTSGGTDGWLIFTLNQTYTRDPDKNLLIGVASGAGDNAAYYSGYTKFYMEADGNDQLALSFEGASGLTTMPGSTNQYNRPQMKLVAAKNCTNDSIIVDTNLCENASIDWRGHTISFSDDDISQHYIIIDSTYNDSWDEWDYIYRYVYTEKVEGASASGCDSVYQLRLNKLYNEDNDYDAENSSYPHEVSCGPYTWRNGVTYTQSMGTYEYYNGDCPAYGSYGPRVYDTVPGAASNGCDSIYGLNLRVDSWYTVVFDTTGVDSGTGMKPVYECEGSGYTLPECTMTAAYKVFRAWEWDGDWYDPEDFLEADWIEDDTIYLTPVFECDVEEIATEYEDLCPNGGEYEWRGKTITMDYALQHGRRDSIAGVDYINVYDTVAGAIGGVCDSIYTLLLRMENKISFDERVLNQCEAQAFYWIEDYKHYGSDMGWRWVDDGDDGYKEFDMSTAARYLDSFANGECGKMYLLSLEIEDDGEDHDLDTVIFIKYKIEWGDGIDTLYSMTMYVCEDYAYYAPECPDTVTREGYDFVYWSDWPECGWEVEPGSEQWANGTTYLYGMWESNCEDKEAADTTVMCPNDTLSWHGFTLNGPELQIGEWDSNMVKYGVIPGECDSIYHMHVTVLSRPTLSVTGQEEPLCAGMSTGWISVAVSEGNTPFQYAMGDSNYTAAFDTTEHKFENLAAGTHTVWVKDNCGVTEHVQVDIVEPAELTANITSSIDSAVCLGAGKQLNAEVTGGTSPYTYLWNRDSTRMNDTLMVSTNAAGTYTDTIFVTDDHGCSAEGYYTTTVKEAMTVSIIGNDTTYCYGADADTLRANANGGFDNTYIFTWYNENEDTVSTISTYKPSTAETGEHEYHVTLTDQMCGTEISETISITVLDTFRVGPLSEINETYCYGANASQIEVPVSGGGTFSGQWYMNGTAVTDHNPGDADNKYTPRTDTAGTFNYSLKAVSNSGCGNDSVTVGTVTVYAPYSVSINNQDTNYCVGQQADTLRIASVNGGSGVYTYQWEYGGSQLDGGTNNYYLPDVSNIHSGYTYSVHIMDGACFDTTVTVATIIVHDTGLLEYTFSSNTYCLNADATEMVFNAGGSNVVEDEGDLSMQWYENGTAIAGADSNKYTMPTTTPGTYNYSVKVSAYGGCLNDSVLIATNTVRNAMAVTVSNQDTAYCYGANADTLRVASVTGGSSEYIYTWLKDGEELSSEATLVPSTTEVGTKVYSVKVRDAGCSIDTIVDTTIVVASITVYGENVTHDTLVACDSLQWIDGNTYTVSTGEMDTIPYYIYAAADQHGCDSTVYLNKLTIYETMHVSADNGETLVCIFDTVDIANNDNPWTPVGPVSHTGGSSIIYTWYRNGNALDGHSSDSVFNLKYTTVGVYNYTVVATDSLGCGRDSIFVGTHIVSRPFILSKNNADTINYCINSEADTLGLNITYGSGHYLYQWLEDGENVANGSDSLYVPSTNEAGTHTYSLRLFDSICGTDTTVTMATITVNPTLVASIEPDTMYNCMGNEGSFTVTVADGNEPTYQWYRNSEPIADETSADINFDADSAGTFIYSVVVTDGAGCGRDSIYAGRSIVYSPMAVTIANQDTAYCFGAQADTLRVTSIANGSGNFTYRWYMNGEEAMVSETETYQPSTGEVGSATYSVRVTDGECGTDTIITVATITVLDSLTVGPVSEINESYCMGVNASQIEVPVSGGGAFSGQWYMNGEPVTDHDAGDAANKYTPRTDTAGIFNYSLKIVSNAGCGSDSVTVGTVTVKGPFTVTVENQDSAYCYGDYPAELKLDSVDGIGDVSYEWYKDSVQVAQTATYRPSGYESGEFVYSVKAIHECGNDTTVTVATITVQESISANTFVDTSYCFGATPEPITLNTTGGNGTYSYYWLVADNDDMIPADSLPTTTNVCVPLTDTSSATYYYRVYITSGGCSTSIDVARIDVMEQVVVQVTADSSAICLGTEGTTYELTDHTSGGTYSNYTYKWYENGGELFDETSSSYMPVGSTAGTFTYSAIAIDELGCTSDTTTVGVLTVYDKMAVTVANQDTAYCKNADADTLRIAGVTGGNNSYTYRWFVHDFYETVLSTTANYKPATDAAGTTIYDVQVTDNECGTDTTITVATVTVHNTMTASVNGYYPGAVCIHSEQDTLFVQTEGGSGNYTYQWLLYIDSAHFDTIDGATQSYYQPTTDTVSTGEMFYVSVKDVNGCGDTLIDAAYIYVTDSVRYSGFTYASDSILCYGVEDSLWVYETGGAGGATYTWYIDGEEVNPNHENNVFTLPAGVAGTFDLSVKISMDVCGSDSAHVTNFTVYDQFEVNAEEQTNTYCLNSTPDTITLAGQISGSGDYSYQWYAVTGSTTEIIDTLAGATNNWYVPATNVAGEKEFRVKVTDLNCGGDTTVSVGSVYVSDSIRITSGVDSLFACLGSEAGTFNVTYEGDGEIDYCWYLNGAEVYRDLVNEFMPSSDSAGVFNYYLVLRSGYGCASDSVAAGLLTVYEPMAVTVANQDTDYCYGTQADTLRVTSISNGSGNFTYRWMQNGDMVSENEATFVPSTTEVGATTYSVTVMDNDCGTDTTVTVATITVHNGAIVSIDDTTALTACSGAVNWDRSLAVIDTTSETTLTLTYQWYRNDVAIDGATDSTYTITSPLDTTGTFIYTVHVGDNYGCTDTTLHAIRLTAYPNVSWTIIGEQDRDYCINGTAEQLIVVPSGGNGNYTYSWDDNNSHTLSNDTTYTPTIDSIGRTILNFSLRSSGIDYCAGSYGVAYFINMHDISTGDTTVTACDSYTWIDTVTYTETPTDAMPTFVLQNQYGCDSTVTLNLTINYSNSDTVAQTACDMYTWAMTGQTYTTSGYYFDTVQNQYGCDSIVVLNLTVNPSTASNDTMTVCDSYTWNNTNYNTSGTYTANLLNAAGCDSTATLYLTVNYSNSATDTVTTCDSVTWIDGNTYSARMVAESPTYTYANGNAAGCDSVVTLQLILADSYTAYFHCQECDTNFMPNIEVCSLTPQIVMPENEYEYEGHIFIGWIGSPDTVQPGDTVTMTGSIEFWAAWRTLCSNVDTVSYAEMCDGDTITWRGYTVTSVQTEYADTVAGVVDELCDSVYHLLLTVNYPTTSDTTILACDSIWWNNMFFTETPDTTQSYFMARANQYGCDSTAYLNLTVNYSIHDYVVETACDSYVFDSVTYTESTDLPTIGAISDNGCPFITHISLTVNYSYHGEDSATACDLYVWNDMELEEGGDHDYVGYTSDGCDSVVTLHLTMHYTAYGMDTQTACDSMVWIDGNTYFSDFPGDVAEITYTYVGGSIYGCDSVAVLDLTMEDHIYVEFISDFGEGTMDEISSCREKPFMIPQCEYVNEGFVFDGWVNQVVHDTVMPGDTVFLEESTSFIAAWVPLCEDVLAFTDTALCEGSTFVWRGHDYTDELYSGDYEDVAYAVIENYCDSIYYLRLTVYPVSYNEFFDSVTGSVIWYDEEYTTTGDYSRFCGYNRYGCDSTEVLHLIVNLSIDDKDGMIDVKVYPNPTQGIVNLDGVEIRRIAVLDQVGRTVATFDNTNRIDISDLPAGIYTLYLQTSAGDTTRRVVKR
ncbi:MAG: T9SS type A sorting domain-containing protein [Bacteroidales bacterium]|nr:T9SS type A sorting domain-containing protein [Bacteroidales bacterium]